MNEHAKLEYAKLIQRFLPVHGVYEAKRLAAKQVMDTLYEKLEDKELTVEEKQDAIIGILKMMRS